MLCAVTFKYHRILLAHQDSQTKNDHCKLAPHISRPILVPDHFLLMLLIYEEHYNVFDVALVLVSTDSKRTMQQVNKEKEEAQLNLYVNFTSLLGIDYEKI